MGPMAVVEWSQVCTAGDLSGAFGLSCSWRRCFSSSNLTGDESWVYHYEAKSKGQSLQWKHPSSPANKYSRHRLPLGKSFWPSFGMSVAYIGALPGKGSNLTSARYSDMLVNEMKTAVRSKRRGLLSKSVLLLHDNARPHTAAHTVDTLRALKFEVLKHPPYSPDLAPSDFHLFGPMKEHLRGQKFVYDNEVMEAVQRWLTATPKSFIF
jgi:histone-lysine N-methyltransferase SETMAR